MGKRTLGEAIHAGFNKGPLRSARPDRYGGASVGKLCAAEGNRPAAGYFGKVPGEHREGPGQGRYPHRPAGQGRRVPAEQTAGAVYRGGHPAHDRGLPGAGLLPGGCVLSLRADVRLPDPGHVAGAGPVDSGVSGAIHNRGFDADRTAGGFLCHLTGSGPGAGLRENRT